MRLDVRQAGPAQFGFAVDHQGAGGDVAQALEGRMVQATEQTEGVAEGQDVGEAQQVAQQRRGPAHRSAVVVDDAQSHHLLAGRAALVEHLEEDHVPPGHDEGQQQAEAGAELAEERQAEHQHQHDQAADAEVDGIGQGPGDDAGGTQEQVDAFRRFHVVVGVEDLGAWPGGGRDESGGRVGESQMLASVASSGNRAAATARSAPQLPSGRTPKMVR